MNDPNARTTPRPAGQRRPSQATFRRRRAVVGGVLAALVAVGAPAAHDVLAGSGGVPASAAEGLPALVDGRGDVPQSVTAQPGDTLWEIAQRYRGEISVTRYVDKLVDLNGGPSLQAGQPVLLP